MMDECPFLHIHQHGHSDGLARLGNDHLRLQGHNPFHIHFNQILSFEPQADSIRLDTIHGKIKLNLPSHQARNWLKAITNTQPLEQKLGLQSYYKAALFGFIPHEIRQAVRNTVYAWASFASNLSVEDINLIPGRFDAIFVHHPAAAPFMNFIGWQTLLDYRNIFWLVTNSQSSSHQAGLFQAAAEAHLVPFHVVNISVDDIAYGFVSKKHGSI